MSETRMLASARSLARRAVHKGRRTVRRSRLCVRHRSSATGLFHCCVPKTASQWILGILRDPRVYRYSGFDYFNYNARLHEVEVGAKPSTLTARKPNVHVPSGRVTSPVYAGFEAFQAIPKPDGYRAFFVQRDPRDVVVSWYFSMKFSHRLMGDTVERWREDLQSMPEEEGLCYAVRVLSEDQDLFGALRSWSRASVQDPACMVACFEDLVARDNLEIFVRLFEHCDIGMPRRTLRRLLADHSFENLSGRKRGQEDKRAHLRKGQPGDWRNHFSTRVLDAFECATGDLVARLGYEPS